MFTPTDNINLNQSGQEPGTSELDRFLFKLLGVLISEIALIGYNRDIT